MWHNIKLNSNLVQTETERAVLIKLPKEEFKFWHPKKCVRNAGGGMISIGIADDMTIKCFRNGNGKYNFKEVIAEKSYTADEFIAQYGGRA